VIAGALRVLLAAPMNYSGLGISISIDDPLALQAITGNLYLKTTSAFNVNASGQLDLSASLLSQTDSGEVALLSGAFTWDGTAPTSFLGASYRYVKIGNLVTLWVRISYNSAGNANTTVTFALPGPTPTTFATTANSTAAVLGAGELAQSLAGGTLGGVGGSSLAKDSGGNWIVAIGNTGFVNAKAAWATLTYYA
jgi:hypothetical protein